MSVLEALLASELNVASCMAFGVVEQKLYNLSTLPPGSRVVAGKRF